MNNTSFIKNNGLHDVPTEQGSPLNKPLARPHDEVLECGHSEVETMGAHFKKALTLLAENKPSEARALLQNIEAEMEALEQDREFIEEMIARYEQDHPTSKNATTKRIVRNRLRKLSDQAERSAIIKKHAQEIAATNSGKVNIDAVNRAIQASGFELDTKVPGTVIANVIMKTPGWERVSKGEFRYSATEQGV